MRRYIFSSHFLVEMLISLVLLVIIFKLFIFEISHIQSKKNVLSDIKSLNKSYLALTHISNRCLGIGNTNGKDCVFYGRPNSLLFLSSSRNKLYHFLKFKDVHYFYLFNNKIKETITTKNVYNPIQLRNSKVLCHNVSYLKFLYLNALHGNPAKEWINKEYIPRKMYIILKLNLYKGEKYIIFSKINMYIY
jgi:hypothetical protein